MPSLAPSRATEPERTPVHLTAPVLPAVPVALRSMHEPAQHDPVGLFDATCERILAGGPVARAVDLLSDGLWWMRAQLPDQQWQQAVALLRAHPLLGLLHENPFARRAFLRPRGHTGDARLLDLLYDGRAAPEARGASPLGYALLARDTATPLAAAVRERRGFMAELIDHVAEARPRPRILAAGCGHLREGLLSAAVQQRRIGRLVALDRDAEALAEVERCFAGKGVEPTNCGIDLVLEAGFTPASFDMVYAAGLYDRLGQRRAAALTLAFFALLRPGGRLVIASFARGIYDAAYLEAVANWPLACRDAAEMQDLAASIDPGEIAFRRVYTRQSPDIFYLELRRRGTPGQEA
jgi:SAM-dependent methyltransferase